MSEDIDRELRVILNQIPEMKISKEKYEKLVNAGMKISKEEYEKLMNATCEKCGAKIKGAAIPIGPNGEWLCWNCYQSSNTKANQE